MKRIALIGAAAAVLAAGTISTAASAAPTCTCAKPSKAKHHVRHKVRRHHAVARNVTPRTVQVVETVAIAHVDTPTYESNGEFLPDPFGSEKGFARATASEDEIASELNKNLDLWRSCGWLGQERAAAVFATWSRTHVENDLGDPRRLTVSWKPYALVSAERMDETDEPHARAEMCNTMVNRRTEIKYAMDRQASDLMRAHAAVHGIPR